MNSGDVIAGRFEIEHEAGAGGMGVVYRARDRQTGEPVAVKVLHGQGAMDAERFVRESTTLAELTHPGIVRHIQSGAMPDGARFMTMEWLEGEDLAAHLEREGLTISESLALVRRVADALAVAHTHGVVHRDIKPKNIFLPGGQVERVKLLDFGIARRTREQRGLTRTGVLLGTPEYMAPEQARGSREVGARADVFALGCVLFECLTGRAAFVGDNLMAVLAKILLEDAPRVSSLRPTIPAALDDLVARLVAKDPAGRPADGAAVSREIIALGNVTGERAAPIYPRQIALTGSELRMVSVVVAGRQAAHAAHAATVLLESDVPREALAAAVAPLGARVEFLADGSVIATLSGAGTATDQAARAAQCALALRPLLPDASMVLATGRGVVSGTLPVGEVIDRAVRALALAPPGGVIRLDEVTAGLIDGRFDVGGDGAGLYLRGAREAGEAARTVLGKPTTCVGRERELSALDATLEECASEPVARVALVIAPAGAGKSRLLQEFLRRAQSREAPAEVLRARGDSVSSGAPFAMLASALRRAAGVLEGEGLEVRRRKLRARLARHLIPSDLPRVAEFLGEMAGAPVADAHASDALRSARADPMLMGDQMRRAFEDWLAAECATQPVLLVLEDLHWGDLPTVNFVDGALRLLRDRPLMVLALARPEVHERFPRLWAEREVQEVRLGALTKKAAEKLVREVLGDAADAVAVARIVERAEGNAFFLEELVRAYGSGQTGSNALGGRGGDALPETVLGMVQARLDALDDEARRVLRAASIFGQTFWRGGVMQLLGGEQRTTSVTEWLDDLVAREVVARGTAGAVPGDAEYQFRNALVRDAAYAMLTDHDRVLGHKLAAEWLVSAGGQSPLVLAEHFDRGAEPARAAEWYSHAAEEALQGNDLVAAVARATRGLELGAVGDALPRSHLALGEARFWRGEHAQSAQSATAAMALVAVGSADWYHASTGVVLALGQMGRLDEVVAHVESVLASRASPGCEGAKVLCLHRAGTQFISTGRDELVERISVEIERIAAECPTLDPRARAVVELLRSIPRTVNFNPLDFIRRQEIALGAVERAGDARVAINLQSNLGHIYGVLGDYEHGGELLTTAMTNAERMGAHHLAALAMHNLGNVLTQRGKLIEARQLEVRSIAAFVAQGNPRLEAASRIYLAAIEAHEGDHAAAEAEARRALALLSTTSLLRVDALTELIRALVGQGRTSEAAAFAHALEELINQTGFWSELKARPRVTIAEAFLATGDRARARAALLPYAGRVRQLLPRIGDEALRAVYLRIAEVVRLFELERELGGG